MDKIKTIKIKNPDGSVSEETYTISVDAKDVDMKNGKDLQDTIGNIDIDTNGNIAEQLDYLNDNVDNLNIDINKKAYFFDTVEDMKNANLKVGDYVCTLGYYEINDGGAGQYKILSSSNKYVENLKNNLKAELIITNNKINIKQIGCNNIDSISDQIQNYINNFVNGAFTFFIPAETFNSNEIIIPWNKGGINFEGAACRVDSNQNLLTSTIVSTSESLFKVGHYDTTSTSIYNYMNFGFSVKNLNLKGVSKEIAKKCFYFNKCSDIIFQNVRILGFDEEGLLLEDVYDSVFNNVTIGSCGKAYDETTAEEHGAITLQGKNSSTNAIRIINSRLENNHLSLLFNKGYINQIMVHNTKFETGATGQNDPYMIKHKAGSNINFTNCIFTPTSVNYMFNFDYDNKLSTTITGCAFTYGTTGNTGGKYINVVNGIGLVINGCTFYNMNTEAALILKNTVVTGCHFICNMKSVSDIINGPITLGSSNIITGCRITPSTYSGGAFFNVNGSNNRIVNNSYANTISSGGYYINSSNVNNEYEPQNFSSINKSDDTLDASRTVMYRITDGVTLTKCINGYNGQIVTCRCTGNVTLQKSSSFCPNLSSATKTYSNGEIFQIIYDNQIWYLI